MGSAWVSLSLQLSPIADETLQTEPCLDKVERVPELSRLVSLISRGFSSVDVTTISSDDPSDFVKSKPEDWSSWYEPSASIFA